MTLTLTNPVHVVEAQDEAMDSFRKLFKLVAECKVSDDGMVMIYQLKTLPTAARWLSDAQAVISANQLPLEPGVKAYKRKGEEVPHRVELRIVYTPKEPTATEAPMPVGYAEHHPVINLAGIDPHLQHAFSGLIY